MPGERFFCSVESRSRAESIFGTVAHIRSWLLLEYPGVWRRHAIEDSRLLSARVRAHIRKLREQGAIDRALLVRRQHQRTDRVRCFYVRSVAGSWTIQSREFSD